MSLALIARPPAGAAFCAMVAFSSSGVCVPRPWIAPPLRLCGRAWFGIGVELRVGVGRVVHSERTEDVIVDVLLPRLAADFLDQLAGGHVEDVVVGIAAAEAGRGLQIADAAHRLLARKRAVREEQQVALAEAEAAAVNEQVADRHLARDPRIPHAEIRHVVDDLVVPLDLAFVDQRRERSVGEGLAGRSGEEDRVGIDRLVGRDVAHAPALRQRHLAILDDGDGDARHAELLAQLLDALRRTPRAEPRAADAASAGAKWLRAARDTIAFIIESLLLDRERLRRQVLVARTIFQMPTVTSGRMKIASRM